ncbi:MAG: hypothetical protein R3A44_12790 [Caldilineaceae bacterium]
MAGCRVEILFELEQEALAQVLGFGNVLWWLSRWGLQEMVVESARG